jgi:hypothetical protein
METDPVSETSCFLFSRIPDDEKSPKSQKFYVLALIFTDLNILSLSLRLFFVCFLFTINEYAAIA